MKYIINEFQEWKDEEGDCSLGQDVGHGYATFYEIVSDDYLEQYSIENNKLAKEIYIEENGITIWNLKVFFIKLRIIIWNIICTAFHLFLLISLFLVAFQYCWPF